MSYFFQRKKYIKKESFPFFLTKISDFGVKMMRRFLEIFDSSHLFGISKKFHEERRSLEIRLFRLYGSREQALWEPWAGSMGAVRAHYEPWNCPFLGIFPWNLAKISEKQVIFGQNRAFLAKIMTFSWKIMTFFRK